MKLIKNAIVYKALLPNADLLRGHLAERPMGEMLSLDMHNQGFVPNDVTKELVTEFQGGLSFDFRYDEKVIPPSTVKEMLKDRMAEIAQMQGYAVGRKQRLELREDVLAQLATNALVRTTIVTCFYDTANQFLIVPVASATMADRVIREVILAVGSVETRTINISDVKNGLSTRLKAWLDGDETVFGAFEPCEEVNLVRNGDKINVRLPDLDNRVGGIEAALEADFVVDAIRFNFGETASFKLTSQFRFKSIGFGPIQKPDEMDPIGDWIQEAAVQTLEFAAAVKNLCDLLGYKEPEADEKLAA